MGVGLRGWTDEAGANANNSKPYQQLPALDAVLFAQFLNTAVTPGEGPPTYLGVPGNGIVIYMRSGVALSGSIDLLWCDARLVVDLPDAMT